MIDDAVRDYHESTVLGFVIKGHIPDGFSPDDYWHHDRAIAHVFADHLHAAGYLQYTYLDDDAIAATVKAYGNCRTLADCLLMFDVWTSADHPGGQLISAVDLAANVAIGPDYHVKAVQQAARERRIAERLDRAQRLLHHGKIEAAAELVGGAA